jgi:hypothetical protein
LTECSNLATCAYSKCLNCTAESTEIETVHLCHQNIASPVKPSRDSPLNRAQTFKVKKTPCPWQSSASLTLSLSGVGVYFPLTDPTSSMITTQQTQHEDVKDKFCMLSIENQHNMTSSHTIKECNMGMDITIHREWHPTRDHHRVGLHDLSSIVQFPQKISQTGSHVPTC